MCYIAMSYMGLAGYVVIGDTLCNPNTTYDSRGLLPVDNDSRIWYTPMFMTRDIWVGRRIAAGMDLMLSGCRKETAAVPAEGPLQSLPETVTVTPPVVISPEPKKSVEAEETAYADNGFGQLSFF